MTQLPDYILTLAAIILAAMIMPQVAAVIYAWIKRARRWR